MERRTKRVRGSQEHTNIKETTSSGIVPGGRTTKSSPKITSTVSSPSSSQLQSVNESTASQEEVVLNARGMPVRQRKKNRFYYDEDTMITPDISRGKGHTKRIKTEPAEIPDEPQDESDTFEVSSTTSPRSPFPLSKMLYPAPYKTPNFNEKSSSSQLANAISAVKAKSQTRRSTAEIPVPTVSPQHATAPGSPGKRGRPRVSVKDTTALTPKPRLKSLKEAVEEAGYERIQQIKKRSRDQNSTRQAEISKKPSRYIKIKREPDMSFGPPQHIVNDNTEEIVLTFERDRLQSGLEFRGDTRRGRFERTDESMIKQDYNDPFGHSTGARTSFGYDNEYSVIPTRAIKHDATERHTLDKKTAHEISLRLRNLLKLPKAHKWVCYEWFYSNIDKVLFEGENDFQICLKESFPDLRVKRMSRAEWCKVRRLMGKPRRCSQSFFDEEREELYRRRQKIRMIQQRKMTDFSYKELPDEIPLQLVIGTKVTSRLRKPQDGLFTGTIDGVDTSNNTYRITFDRPGLGTHSIPDYEVLSNEAPETVSTSSFSMKLPRRTFGNVNNNSFKFQTPGINDSFGTFPKSPFPMDGMLGGFPIRLLDMIVRLSKLLKGKREKILQLKELNVEAEKIRSYGKKLNDDYRVRYARVVVDLESMNKEMALYLDGIQQYCLEIAPDHGANQMIIPEHVQESSRQEAGLIVDTFIASKTRTMVQGVKPLNMICEMISLMLQVKALSSGERNLYELKSIKDTLSDMKASLGGENVQLFQDLIEIPMNRVQTGLTLPCHK